MPVQHLEICVNHSHIMLLLINVILHMKLLKEVGQKIVLKIVNVIQFMEPLEHANVNLTLKDYNTAKDFLLIIIITILPIKTFITIKKMLT